MCAELVHSLVLVGSSPRRVLKSALQAPHQPGDEQQERQKNKTRRRAGGNAFYLNVAHQENYNTFIEQTVPTPFEGCNNQHLHRSATSNSVERNTKHLYRVQHRTLSSECTIQTFLSQSDIINAFTLAQYHNSFTRVQHGSVIHRRHPNAPTAVSEFVSRPDAPPARDAAHPIDASSSAMRPIQAPHAHSGTPQETNRQPRSSSDN